MNYYLRGLQNLPLTNKLIEDDSLLPEISVLVTARNEENNIRETIISLSKQNYPLDKFKIIAVDDRSTDSTGDILNSLLEEVKNLEIIYLTKDDFIEPDGKKVKRKLSKKDALKIGISSLTTEFVVTTDADCVYNENWLRSYGSSIVTTNKNSNKSNDDNDKNQKLGIVAAVTIFHKEKYSNFIEKFWQEMQYIDFFSQSLLGAGAIGHNRGFTANGSNLMLKRSLYDDDNNSSNNDVLKGRYASGDDFFLIQSAEKENLKLQFLTNEESVVKSLPVNTIKELFNQRARWASKAGASNRQTFLFTLNTFIFYTGVLIYLFLTIFLPLYFSKYIFILLLALKIFPETMFLSYGFGKFNVRLKPFYYIFLQLFHIPFNLAAGLKGVIFGFTWKGEKYN